MILKGDISTFHPGNLLLFFADFERQGLLTVNRGNDLLTISLKGAKVINAHSKRSDEKLLNALFLRKLVNRNQLQEIKDMKRETDLPTVLIIEKLATIDLTDIRQEIKNSIYEVLFHLFLMDQGQFHLTDVAVEQNGGLGTLDCRTVALEMSRWVDEWQEIERALTSLDRITSVAASPNKHQSLTPNQKLILNLARKPKTIRQIVTTAPITSYAALKTVNQIINLGWLELAEDHMAPSPPRNVQIADLQFNSFRNSFRKIIQAPDRQTQIAKFITFCRDNFDLTLVISCNTTDLRNCIAFTKKPNGIVLRKDKRHIQYPITLDPIFKNVLQTGHSFFGNVYESEIIKRILKQIPQGDCALLRFWHETGHVLMIYTVLRNRTTDAKLFHYLEILAWIINPPREAPEAFTPEATATIPERPAVQNQGRFPTATARTKLHQLVEAIDELPPIPQVVSQIMDLLSDPEYDISKMADILTNDQILVVKLLKVSNSALYGRGEAVSNLKEALTRIGTKAVKSIVITASLRSFFKEDNSRSGKWCQELWRHSKHCGLASRAIADFSGYPDPEEAFVGGVLHDIGKLIIILQYPDIYASMLANLQLNPLPIYKAEKNALGFDHADIGSLLMKRWGMPLPLINCVRYHHSPIDAKEYSNLVRLITLGNQIGHLLSEHPQAQPSEPDHSEPPKLPSEENNQIAPQELLVTMMELATNLSIPLDNAQALFKRLITDFAQVDIFD